MDIAHTTYSIIAGIVNFVSEHYNKNLLQLQIADIAIQIQTVIRPLLLQDIPDAGLRLTLQRLNAKLQTVDNHLRSWTTSSRRWLTGVIYPWAVTQEMRDDCQLLMNQYMLIIGAMNAHELGIIRGYNLLPPAIANSTFTQPPHSISPDEDELLRFWHTRIGNDQVMIESQRLCNDLSSWLNIDLKGITRSRLLLRLDETNSGKVTLKMLQGIVYDRKLKEAVLLYSSDPELPLLIWISDDFKINAYKVAFAQRQGVCVVQLATTTSAKAWINVNKKFLQKYDKGSDLRFISDQTRWELDSKDKPYYNHNAGTQIIKFIRHEQGFKAPVLIYTSEKTVPRTRYVESYKSAGSTGNYDTYKKYVLALAARRNDDHEWVGCPAKPAQPK